MGTYKEIQGNLITLAKEGKFDVIAHGCNCFCRMKRGIAPQMAEAFGCDSFPLESKKFEGDINKLGQIDCLLIYDKTLDKQYTVINAYTQYQWGTQLKPFDYEAFTLCMRKINNIFKGKNIGLPQIGSHLAGGIWSEEDLSHEERENLLINFKDIKTIIKDELKDCKITIVIFKP